MRSHARPAMRVAFAAALALGLPHATLGAERSGGAPAPRDDDPVIVRGSNLPGLQGLDVRDFGVFRWNASSQSFEPIPFQLDERLPETFNAGTPYEFTETLFDVFGDDDGLFDADDEIAFLFGDAGPQAPTGAPWVQGAAASRAEVRVVSNLPGQAALTRWAYVFTGPGLPRSTTSYVSWSGAPDAAITTDRFSVEYSGNWLLTGLRIFPPCGDGTDLLDRVKGRVAKAGMDYETEQAWDGNSQFLGGLVGPVRAIRYVRGASSGVNTIHHDIVYRGRWRRRIELRVHPVQSVKLYFDWRPLTQGEFYSATLAAPVSIDGVPDAVPSTFAPWSLMRSAGGGFVLLTDVPPNPLYQTRESYYVDNASYNDALGSGENYPDDDDSAYGDEGFVLRNLGDSTVSSIQSTLVGYPLCADVGDAGIGAAYRQFIDNPLQQTVTEQSDSLAPVRTLQVARDGADVVLSWQAVAQAQSYRIYKITASQVSSSGWVLAGTTGGLTYRDAGAASGDSAFYSVAPVDASGEGEW